MLQNTRHKNVEGMKPQKTKERHSHSPIQGLYVRGEKQPAKQNIEGERERDFCETAANKYKNLKASPEYCTIRIDISSLRCINDLRTSA